METGIARRGLMLVLSSPSGAGKTTLARRILEEEPGIAISVSHTTRKKRKGETDGKDYHFVDHDTFTRMRDQGEFLEWAVVFDNYYGTTREPVERALSEVRLRKERETLALSLSEANEQLEHRVKELTLLFGIGKAIVSLNHLDRLYDRLMEGARYATNTEMGWLLQRDDAGRELILRSQHGLPQAVAAKVNQPWDDGVAPLVIASGEGLRLSGVGLQRFKIAQVCRSVMVAPIKAKAESLGVIAVGHPEAREFTIREQAMLEAVADYASIAMINARLFRALESRAASEKAPTG